MDPQFQFPYLKLGSLKLQGGPLIPLNVWEVPGFYFWVYFLYRTTNNSNMGVQVYCSFFFITGNQEFQHGSPDVLGFIFYYGQPRIPT